MGRICGKLNAEVAALRDRELAAQRYPYPWVDAACAPCRCIVGLSCVNTESHSSWEGFLRELRGHGLDGVQCVTSDANGGIVRAVRELLPGAARQRRVVHLERDVIDAVTTGAKQKAVCQAACSVVSGLSEDAGRVMEGAEPDAPAHLDFPGTPQAHAHQQRPGAVQRRDLALHEGRAALPRRRRRQ